MKHFLLFSIVCLLSMNAAFAGGHKRITPAEIVELTQALSDEAYDYGLYTDYYHIGENIGTPGHWKARVRVYIDPEYSSEDGHGRLIYKLMPYGEVYRIFFVDKEGKITLDGTPQNKFPITQPSHQTVYMDEEEVRQYENLWMKSTLTIDTQPSAEIIESSSQRQKKRTGFSDWEYKQANKTVRNK